MNPENLIKNPGRRAKGKGNVLPPGAKRMFLEAFHLVGGTRGLYKWATKKYRYKLKHADGSHEWVILEPNRTKFYELLSILIPAETRTRVSGTVEHAEYRASPRPVAPEDEHREKTTHDLDALAADRRAKSIFKTRKTK